MAKRFVALFLAMLCISLAATAEQEEALPEQEISRVILNSNFVDGEIPAAIGLGLWGSAKAYIISTEGGQNLLEYNTPASKESRFTLSVSDENEAVSNGTFILKTKLKFSSFNLNTSIFMLFGTGGNTSLFRFGDDGFIYVGGSKQTNVGRYLTDTWYDIAIALDITDGVFSAYLDGSALVRNASCGLTDISQSMRLMHHPAASGGGIIQFEYTQCFQVAAEVEAAVAQGLPYLELPETEAAEVIAAEDTPKGRLAASYVEPEEVIRLVKENFPNKTHPRLFATTQDFEHIKTLVKENETAARWYEHILNEAEEAMEMPLFIYNPDNVMYAARDMLGVGVVLGFTYNMTGDEKYAQKAYELMESCAQFELWRPSHFLDTAEMTAALGIGYDLIYNFLTDAQREIIRTAMLEKGLIHGLESFYPGSQYSSWLNKANNWSQVCNGGMIVGALAVADEFEDVAGRVVHHTHRRMAQQGLQSYYDDGSYFEGPGYFRYSTRYLTFAMAAMNSVLGDDFGYSQFTPLETSARFGMALNGVIGDFNYNDSGTALGIDANMSYLSKHFDDALVAKYIQTMKKNASPLDLIWFYEGDMSEEELPLDTVIKEYPMFFTRSEQNYKNTSGIWAALKGQRGSHSRMDLDCGSFMLEALGSVWTIDPGAEGYTSAGYWEVANNGGRYQYYKKRAEGHNTIVINPDKNADQVAQCFAPIVASGSGAGSAFAVVDMAPAYEGKVVSAKRGLTLFDGRSKVAIRDEISMKEPSEFYWFMHTPANIEIQSDAKTAVLSQNGKRLLAKILSNEDLKFSVMPAKALPQTDSGAANTNLEIDKLTIHGTNVKELELTVVFVPLREEDRTNVTIPALPALDMWEAEQAEGKGKTDVTLNSITLDGVEIEGFDPYVYDYSIEFKPWIYSAPPQINAWARVNYEVAILGAQTLPGTAKIMVKDDRDPERYMYYTIRMKYAPFTKLPDGLEHITPIKIIPSDVPEPGNHEMNIIDGSYQTRWAAYGDQWLILEYDKEQAFKYIGMSFMGGGTRIHPIEVSVSKDGKVWEEVYKGASTPGTEEMVYYRLQNTVGKYVRINFHGNQSNLWNSITELWLCGEI